MRRLVVALLLASGCAPNLDGHYLSCPYPSFSGFRVILEGTSASLWYWGDRGPISGEFHGTYGVERDRIRLRFTSGSSRGPSGEEPVSAEHPYVVVQELLENAGEPMLGRWLMIGPEDHVESVTMVPFRMIRIGGPDAPKPASLECPP